MPFLVPRWDSWLVAGSMLISAFACHVAIEMRARADVVGQPSKPARAWWLGGSLALGTGIWAMHFVGMLAFSLPITVKRREFAPPPELPFSWEKAGLAVAHSLQYRFQ